MSRITTAGFLAALVLAGVHPGHARENGETPAYPTNMAMLTDAAQSSVSEMLLTFNLPRGSSILLESESPHEARWFIENLILDQLTDRGFVVTLKPEDENPSGPGTPASKAVADTALGRTRPDTVAAEGTDDPPVERQSRVDSSRAGFRKASKEPEADYVFRFRVAECGLTYPKAFRKSPLGAKLVQRFASVSVFGTVVKGDRESVVWVGRGDAERLDHVPSGKLPLLEGKTFPFTHPEVESRGLDAYAEPALVLSIVLGLVYLFYTNQ